MWNIVFNNWIIDNLFLSNAKWYFSWCFMKISYFLWLILILATTNSNELIAYISHLFIMLWISINIECRMRIKIRCRISIKLSLNIERLKMKYVTKYTHGSKTLKNLAFTNCENSVRILICSWNMLARNYGP